MAAHIRTIIHSFSYYRREVLQRKNYTYRSILEIGSADVIVPDKLECEERKAFKNNDTLPGRCHSKGLLILGCQGVPRHIPTLHNSVDAGDIREDRGFLKCRVRRKDNLDREYEMIINGSKKARRLVKLSCSLVEKIAPADVTTN